MQATSTSDRGHFRGDARTQAGDTTMNIVDQLCERPGKPAVIHSNVTSRLVAQAETFDILSFGKAVAS